MSVEKEMKVIADAIKSDAGYYISWQANLACAFQDEWQFAAYHGGLPCKPEHIHEIANKAAARFIKNCFGADDPELSASPDGRG